MMVLVIVLGAVAAWGALALPLAVAVGRAFRASGEDAAFEDAFAAIVRDYDAAGV